MFKERVETTTNNVPVHAHVKALPQVDEQPESK